MTSGPVKRSLTLRGHRTSVSLEEPFWRELRRLATEDGVSMNQLAQSVDEARGEAGLASALRVRVLERALAKNGPAPAAS